MSKGYRLEG